MLNKNIAAAYKNDLAGFDPMTPRICVQYATTEVTRLERMARTVLENTALLISLLLQSQGVLNLTLFCQQSVCDKQIGREQGKQRLKGICMDFG
jgi:hypothetical protein